MPSPIPARRWGVGAQTALGLSVYRQMGLFPLQWRFVTTRVNQQPWGLYLQVGATSPPSPNNEALPPPFAFPEQRLCEQVEQPRDAIQRYQQAPVLSLLRRGNDLTQSQVDTAVGRRYAVRVEPDEVKLPNSTSDAESSSHNAGLAAYHALVAELEACVLTSHVLNTTVEERRCAREVERLLDVRALLTYVAINTLLRNGDSTDELFLVGRRRHDHQQQPLRSATNSPSDWYC